MNLKSIAVFCGSSSGHQEVYTDYAHQLGQRLAEQNIQLIYGGAKVGLMGTVADGALAAGGQVIGVIPHFLSHKEIAHSGLTELILVDSMHDRKTRMNELAEGVIALPGGFGTMEEFFEMLTWGQLGLHQKPMGVLNVRGFYNPLLTLARQMHEQGFLKKIHLDMLSVAEEVDALIQQMHQYRAPAIPKWINQERT